MLSLPRAEALVPRLEVLASVGSTNAALAVLAGEGAPPFTAVVTDDQTAGRARLDRSWVTPAGTALAVSVLLPLVGPLGWLPLAAGIAMAEAVAAVLPDREVGLKWPNDVLVGGRKVCGILADVVPGGVVMGAGVNTAMSAEQLPVPTATSLSIEGADAVEDAVVAAYLGALVSSARALAAEPAAAARLRDAARACCVTLGRRVRVELPAGAALEGRADDIDVDGRLVVIAADGAQAVAAGDVVHVR